MKIQRFYLPGQIDAWEALENDEGVRIEHRYLLTQQASAGCNEWDTCAYVLFTIQEEIVNLEKENLERIKELAARVAQDKVLPTLRNQTQRELYLLEIYNIDSITAGKVWEYIKMKEKIKEVAP